jgi:hypothetical protein
VNTPLRAFAADPATAGELAARASEWDRHVRFGIWQVGEPEASPGVWCTELVSGMHRYTQFPPAIRPSCTRLSSSSESPIRELNE